MPESVINAPQTCNQQCQNSFKSFKLWLVRPHTLYLHMQRTANNQISSISDCQVTSVVQMSSDYETCICSPSESSLPSTPSESLHPLAIILPTLQQDNLLKGEKPVSLVQMDHPLKARLPSHPHTSIKPYAWPGCHWSGPTHSETKAVFAKLCIHWRGLYVTWFLL